MTYIQGIWCASLIRVIYEKKQYAKTGGYLIAINEKTNQIHEVKIYTAEQIRLMLRELEFKIVEISPIGLSLNQTIYIISKELDHGKNN
jgi:S-ribosylhomocysteine lyase LuxS involved in autoinducer biosynthesis